MRMFQNLLSCRPVLAALATIALTLSASIAAADNTQYVPATADIYLAGQPSSMILHDSVFDTQDSEAGQNACMDTQVQVAPSNTMTFAVTGLAGNNPPVPPYSLFGPDGDATHLTVYNPYTGAGYVIGDGAGQSVETPWSFSGSGSIPLCALIGVFTSDTIPVIGTATTLPPSLDFGASGMGLNFTQL